MHYLGGLTGGGMLICDGKHDHVNQQVVAMPNA